jgi:hypothetical protein
MSETNQRPCRQGASQALFEDSLVLTEKPGHEANRCRIAPAPIQELGARYEGEHFQDRNVLFGKAKHWCRAKKRNRVAAA